MDYCQSHLYNNCTAVVVPLPPSLPPSLPPPLPPLSPLPSPPSPPSPPPPSQTVGMLRMFHPECFVCSRCGILLGEKDPYTLLSTGRLLWSVTVHVYMYNRTCYCDHLWASEKVTIVDFQRYWGGLFRQISLYTVHTYTSIAVGAVTVKCITCTYVS